MQKSANAFDLSMESDTLLSHLLPLPPGRRHGEGESVTTGIAWVERLAWAMSVVEHQQQAL